MIKAKVSSNGVTDIHYHGSPAEVIAELSCVANATLLLLMKNAPSRENQDWICRAASFALHRAIQDAYVEAQRKEKHT